MAELPHPQGSQPRANVSTAHIPKAFPRSASRTGLRIDTVLKLDEIVLDDTPEVRLNDRPKDQQSVLRPLRELSPGQRCSAIRPILLLSGEYPLVIDQPEENLDNWLIRQVIARRGVRSGCRFTPRLPDVKLGK
jgi:hypothetical protein